jgi:hypothetical protein
MTDLELKYYSNPKMQEKFREKMGEWQSGDRIRRKYTIFGDPIDEQIWSKDKMFEIVIIREQSSIKTYWHCQNEEGYERTLTDQDMLSETCVRLPLPIDPENPERGLFGMLEKEEFRGLYPSTCEHQAEWTCRVYKEGTSIFYDSATPTLALLKALAEQWEIIAEEA